MWSLSLLSVPALTTWTCWIQVKCEDCFISLISFNFHINQKGEHSYVNGFTLEEEEAQRC